MSRGGHCDMLGGRGNTEDGPGTLTGTHPRRTEHTHVPSTRCCAARGPGQVPGREMCPHTARVPQLRAATPSQHENTRGRGATFTKEWNGPGIIHSSCVMKQTLVSSASYIH